MINKKEYLSDYLIIQTAIYDDQIIKNAGIFDNISSGITNYFSSHFDPNDKTSSLINFFAPGVVSMMLGGWLGPLFGLMMRVIGIDVASIFSSIKDKLSSLISNDKQITEQQANDLIYTAVQSETDEPIITAKDQLLDNAIFFKTATINLYHNKISEQNLKVIFAARGGLKGKAGGLLFKILSFVLKTALISTGLMVGADVINKTLGRPNAFDGTLQSNKPKFVVPTPISHQTKFKTKSNYSDISQSGKSWSENYSNTQSGIERMLVDFTKQVYDGITNDTLLKQLPSFQNVVDEIMYFNHSAAGDSIVFIPKIFTSKKNLVDHFIDEYAAKN